MILKSNLKLFKLILVSLVFLTFSAAQAQTLKMVAKVSSVTVAGTSNLHDWESTSKEVAGDLVIATDAKSGKIIQSLVVKLPVKTIKSGKGMMDNKTYDAFDSDKNPLITFQLTDASALKVTGKDVETTVSGNLNMAGAVKKISFKSTGTILADGSFQFKGTVPLKMSDFKMKPPTALLGTLKTGDAITIKFDVIFK